MTGWSDSERKQAAARLVNVLSPSQVECAMGLFWELHEKRMEVLRSLIAENDVLFSEMKARAEAAEADRDRLRAALEVAADDLDKAANQFTAIAESQKAGHLVSIVHNPQKFAEKAKRAREAVALASAIDKFATLLSHRQSALPQGALDAIASSIAAERDRYRGALEDNRSPLRQGNRLATACP